MNKKLVAFFVMAIFLVSLVPFVSAEKSSKVQWSEEAKQKIAEAKKNYEKAKEEFKQKKGELKEAKRIEFLKFASNKIAVHIGVMVTALEKTKGRLEKSNLTDSKILDDISVAQVQLSDIEKWLNENEGNITKDQAKEKLQEARKVWEGIHEDIKISVNSIWENRLGNVIVKLENLQNKFDKVRANLSAKGKDVTKLDEYLEEFNSKISEAEKNYEEAKDLFRQAKDASTASEKASLVKQAHEKQRTALGIIKEIKKTLREIVKEIKKQGFEKELEQDKEKNETESKEGGEE